MFYLSRIEETASIPIYMGFPHVSLVRLSICKSTAKRSVLTEHSRPIVDCKSVLCSSSTSTPVPLIPLVVIPFYPSGFFTGPNNFSMDSWHSIGKTLAMAHFREDGVLSRFVPWSSHKVGFPGFPGQYRFL